MSLTESLASQAAFDLTYNAAHTLALAALRYHGYRTDKRYLVFQCLMHTVGLSKSKTRLFAICHERRNLAKYEGRIDDDEQLLKEFIAQTSELLEVVSKLK